MRVAFFHLDLGIGGAEQLIVNAAMALKQQGHDVTIFTSHRDPTHCFPEVHPDGELRVIVMGDWLPRNLCNKFSLIFSIIRMVYVVLMTRLYCGRFNCAINDQVAAINPLLWLIAPKVLFYCHFPDYLLTQRKSWWKKVYRMPLDWLEEFCTGKCSKIMVNSQFTATVFRDAFPSLAGVSLEVVYPPVSLEVPPTSDVPLGIEEPFFVSLNRYERKKEVEVALRSFAEIRDRMGAKLCIAGGYDTRVKENVEYHQELVQEAADLKISDDVVFKLKVSNEERAQLLTRALAVLYTPKNEHFGIVPCEAMALGTIIIADDSGGPRESVIIEAGFRCVGSFHTAMERVLTMSPAERAKMGNSGKKHVRERFSMEAFQIRFNQIATS
eukprot:GEMP01047247.1.p1 GENE.GEMP01047247.1~~GEMP01047247.1.p1  ORF type:complete len:383 (+),score=92.42 GEMP01047247.1:169-1317(+)